MWYKRACSVMDKNRLNLLQGPILPTLMRFAAPFMLTSLLTTLYTLTDLFWIGRLHSDAVAAVGIIGFLGWIGDAVATIGRTGISVMVAQEYGRQSDPAKVVSTLSNGLQLSALLAIACGLLGMLILNPFIHLFGLPESVNVLAMEYGKIALIGIPFMMMHFAFSQAYQSLGNSRIPFYINGAGLITNMILDPILIFGIGSLHGMRIAGAALATISAQILVFLLFVLHAKNVEKEGIHAQPLAIIGAAIHAIRPNRSTIRHMIQLGLPVFFLSLTFSGISAVLQRMVSSFGAVAAAVATLGSQMESINWMTVEGFGAANTAMVAQNVGAGHTERVLKIMRMTIFLLTSLGTGVLLIFVLFGKSIFAAFIPNDAQAHVLGETYLLIFGISQPFISLETAAGSGFNGLGKTVPPALTSILLNLCRIPLGYLLMPRFGVYGIWIAMSATSIGKGLINVIWLRKTTQPMRRTLAQKS